MGPPADVATSDDVPASRVEVADVADAGGAPAKAICCKMTLQGKRWKVLCRCLRGCLEQKILWTLMMPSLR